MNTHRAPLPVIQPQTPPTERPNPPAVPAPSDSTPCCDACAANERAVERASLSRPPEQRPQRARMSRDADRLIAFSGVALAAGFLALAMASLALPAAVRFNLWLPLHLALAGGAATAIAAVLPFFTAALAVAPPADPRLRAASVLAVAAGALLVSGGHVTGAQRVAESGGALYLAGLVGLAIVAFRPLRGALGPRRRLVEAAYGTAVACVVTGALLGTAFVAGSGAVLGAWGSLKPAHGWLNLFGFVSLVILATLIHLAPTVSGSRIRKRSSATIAVAGLAPGAPLVAAGYVLGLDPLARIGALLVIAGGTAIAGHGLAARRDRGGWTTELAWHRMAEWSLLAAAAWFAVAAWIAGGLVLVSGAAPQGWRIDLFIVPLALGWIAQVLMGSWTHLLPAIGPGDAARHAAQRRVLARLAAARLVGWNVGVALLAAGLPLAAPLLIAPGAALVATTGLAGLVLFATAAVPGMAGGSPQPSGGRGA